MDQDSGKSFGHSQDEDEKSGGGNVVFEAKLPRKYGNADSNGFTATGAEGGDNDFTFALTDG